MTDDNVIPLPRPLERALLRFNAGLARRDGGHAEWIAGTVEMALALVQARDEFKSDVLFGTWSDSNVKASPNDRAALITMGRNPEAMRACLDATGRTSLERISRYEFPRFTQVRNPPEPSEKPKAKRGRPRKPVIPDEVKVIVDLVKEGKNTREVAEELNLPRGTAERGVRHAKIIEAVTEQVRAEADDEAAVNALPPERRIKFNELLERHKAKLDRDFAKLLRDFNARVEEAAKVKFVEWKAGFFDGYEKYVKEAKVIRDNYKGVMSTKQYLDLLLCAHPDKSASPETCNRATQWLTENKHLLVKPDPKVVWPPLHRLDGQGWMDFWKNPNAMQPVDDAERKARDEWLANMRREEAKKAERSAKAKAAAKRKAENDAKTTGTTT